MKTLRVGITGGIGSGKTTVCRVFASLGIPIYYADERAKFLMNHDEVLKKELILTFGAATFENDQLNRAYLAQLVFNDAEQLAKLNSLVHPAVARDTANWESQYTAIPYTLREAALLYESGSYRKLDKVITVSAPESLRIERVIARDQTTEAAVRARIDKQWPDAQKVELADFVILNDGQHSLIKQVLSIHRKLVELATIGK